MEMIDIMQGSSKFLARTVLRERILQGIYRLARILQGLHYLARLLQEVSFWTNVARFLHEMHFWSTSVIMGQILNLPGKVITFFGGFCSIFEDVNSIKLPTMILKQLETEYK